MKSSFRSVAGIALASFALAFAGGALAQAYPNKPIRIVAPFAAGGSVDLVARIIAQNLTEAFGQPVVVENRSGASGMIGADQVAKAKPDGYTLLANSSIHVIVPSLYSNITYDPTADFVAVGQLTEVPIVMLTGAQQPYKTVADVIAAGKASKDGLPYASAGSGSLAHMAGEVFGQVAGIKVQQIPYKGSGAAMADVIGGQVPLMYDALTAAMPHIKGGKMRALAVGSEKRSPLLPDVPTFAELGYPKMTMSTWHGIWAPKGTPPEIVEKLSAEIAKMSKKPDVREKIESLGGVPVGNTPAQFDKFQKAERAKWDSIVKSTGVKPD
ncbi:MAG: tripartite tricarboxylate transporter substrate binding protein [Burkholderiales bacterium]|nr:tripartite tricarboxylate transporter substrate binding protein [Burkholderiales bacterium]